MDSDNTPSPDQDSQRTVLCLDFSSIAYLRPAVNNEGKLTYTVCLPDGTELATYENKDAAFYAAKQHDLEPVWIH